MKIMLLRLEGVLQSWGERSRWDHRDTSDMPTKSALIGLLGCAMGIPRGDPWLNETARLLKMAVRADRAGSIMTDFHTVQGRICKIPSSEGKPEATPSAPSRIHSGCLFYRLFYRRCGSAERML